MARLEERVLAYLRDHQGAGPREIADALGEPLMAVRRALARLRDAGLVARGEEGRYYAVAYAVKGPGPAELRRRVAHRLEPDCEALAARLEELERRLEELEERLRRLEGECSTEPGPAGPGEKPGARGDALGA